MQYHECKIYEVHGKDFVFFVPYWSILGSLIIHAVAFISFLFVFSPISLRVFKEEPLIVRLLPHRNQIAIIGISSVEIPQNSPEISSGNPPSSASSAIHFQNRVANKAATDPEEGYLPQEYLTSAAIPEDEIDLQMIPSPGEGSFRMQVWINSQGKVTKVDLDVTDAPSWFTAQVIEKFEKCRFRPGLRDDRAVASIMRVQVSY